MLTAAASVPARREQPDVVIAEDVAQQRLRVLVTVEEILGFEP